MIAHFAKGKEIIVEGELSTEKWEDKDGNKRASIKMTVDKVHFCGSKSDSGTGGAYRPATAPTDIAAEMEDDGETLPF